MSKSKDTQNTSTNSGNPVSSQIKTIKIKKGIWRTYDATDGLPGQPNRLLQDKQGYLWIGTSAELCRYDGTEFVTYTIADELVGDGVRALCEDHEGRLWIGTVHCLSCFDGKQFTNYSTEDGLPANDVRTLCTDHQGKLWIGTPHGLSCFDGNRFINYTTADGLIDNELISLCPSIQGGIWVGTGSGISRLDGEEFVTLTTEISPMRGPSMCEDSRGRLWIGTGYQGKGVYCFDGEQFRNYTHEDGLSDSHNFVHTICEDRQGRMWFGEWAGVSCLDENRFINHTRGLWAGDVFDIIEDREGQMWFAHGFLCILSCYDAERVSLLTDKSAAWVSTQDKKGRIWCGGIGIFSIRFDSELSEVEERRIPSTHMGGIYFMVDSKDRLWISPYRDGVYCYGSSDAAWEAASDNESSEPRHFGVSDNLADRGYVTPLLEMKDGTIWFSLAAASRLSRFDPEQIPDGEPLESIDTKGPVRCLIEDKLGRLWMGGRNYKGLSCWDGSELITYTRKDGLPSSNITSLVEDDAGQIWVGTTHGLCCFDGQRFVTYGKERGLRELYHWQSVKDLSGQLWFATRGGIYRTDGEHFQWLTEDDGLPSNRVNAVLPQSDSSMIICTGEGIVRYQLTATLPSPVEIREVVADEVYQNPTELNLTTTAANLLTISYHSLSLATKRMRYSYILEGYDKEWHETWERQARYENLPIGEYTFKVIAINRDLVVSEEPATMQITVVRDPRDVRINNLQTEVKNLRREAGLKYDFHNIIGQSAAIKQVHALMERAIDSGLAVLIIGETGTGKELVAKAIHYNSPRKDGPLKDLNCGAVSRELISSALFGHRKGAFTGATEDRIGLFEAASGGTLLLDEIGEMPEDAQIHLLRVLEEHKVQRLGEHTARDVDVRIIAMTNRDLDQAVRDNQLRKDLYYRLSVFPIYVPALRDRAEDIPLLADHFLKMACDQQSKKLEGSGPGVIDMLKGYSWPGNVRELEHEIYRAVALAEDGAHVQTYHFSSQLTQGESLIQGIISEKIGLSASLELLQRRLIENALKECNGNRTQAARILDTQRPNLVRIMKRLGIE